MMVAVSTVELTIRMLVALAVIGALGWGAMWLARSRLGFGPDRSVLGVVARHQLTRASSVAVVRAGSRHFLVGVNDHAVTLLAEGDDLAADAPPIARDGARPTGAGRDGADGGKGADEGGSGIVDVRTQDRPVGADEASKGGAGKRHRGASGSEPARIGVIEALREKTVRRG